MTRRWLLSWRRGSIEKHGWDVGDLTVPFGLALDLDADSVAAAGRARKRAENKASVPERARGIKVERSYTAQQAERRASRWRNQILVIKRA